jgi:hypothetical protein
MKHCLLRRISAVMASMVLVLAVAVPAFAAFVDKDGTISCPSRPTYLHARYQGNAAVLPPSGWSWITYTWNDNNWHVSVSRGETGGGYWYAVGTPSLDKTQTYAYCS